MHHVRVGTRGSALALTQTNQVVEALRRHHQGVEFEVVTIRTTGDATGASGVPFAAVGTKGMFVKEIEEALLDGRVDLGIHSMKDLPGELAPGLALAATPARKDPRDALISRGALLAELPEGARVGTSSLRRQALLRSLRPDLRLLELRGNLDTRLRKLEEGAYDAIVLACAGLMRMGWADRIVERLDPAIFIPAPGQGALALEARTGDRDIAEIAAPLHDRDTWDALRTERAFQAALGAGCTVPAGAFATVEGDALRLSAFLARDDGSDLRRAAERGTRAGAEALGERAAAALQR